MERRQEKIGGQDILYFDFISSFNNHFVDEEIIPE